MKDLLDIVMMVLFVLFLVYLIRGFTLQSNKRRDERK